MTKQVFYHFSLINHGFSIYYLYNKLISSYLFYIILEIIKTSHVYFEHVNEQVVFLNPKLDLSPMDIFKVVCDGQLVDERGGSFLL